MKVNVQIWIDRYLVKWVVWFLNGLVRIVGKILRPNHNLKKEFSRIAVAKYKGMGSILHATPLLQTLRKKYPNAKITFVSTKSNKAFLETLPFIDELILLDDSSAFSLLIGFPIFMWKLFKRRLEVFIDLEIYAHLSSLITTLSAAKNRFGFHLQSGQYRHGCYSHLIYFNPKAPMSEVYLQMARLLYCEVEDSSLYDYNELLLDDEILKLGVKEPYVVVNPNASDLRLERRWPKQQFISLIREMISQNPKSQVVLIGSPSESKYTGSISDEIQDPKLLNLAGKTTIPELIYLIKGADLIVSNDTGPLHIAFACRTKSIGLFGPIAPTQFTIPQNAIAIYKNVYCSPCVHEFDIPPCRGENVCMQQIEVAEVLVAIGNADIFVKKDNSSEIKYRSKGEPLGVIHRS